MEIIKLDAHKIHDFQGFLKDNKNDAGLVMLALHQAQELFGFIPVEIQKLISSASGYSVGRIAGVISFYSHFYTKPRGKYIVNVCTGTACYVKGAQQILDDILSSMNVKMNETSHDGLLTISSTRCVGACALAPIVTINGEVHGRLKISQGSQIVKDLTSKGKKN